jgi:mRNA interferase RelE/StbE
MYKIILTNRAIKDLHAIDKTEQRKIGIRIKEYSSDPQKYARKLINPKIGTYRFRIGDYRIVFDLEEDRMIILRIGHRKDIYK